MTDETRVGGDATGVVRPSVAEDLAHLLRSQRWILAAAVAAVLLSYGFALTTFSLSIDEELRFLFDDLSAWVEQGRPVTALVKVVLGDSLPLPWVNLALALVFLFVAGVLWAFLFMRASGRRDRPAGLLVFLVVFTTIPVNAYYLHFNTFNIEVSLGFIWAATSAWCAWLWVMEDRGARAALAAVALAVLAVLTYQNLAFASVAGVLIAQLADLLCRSDAPRSGRTRRAVKRSVKLVSPAILALALGVGLSYVIGQRGGYTETFIRWGNQDPFIIIQNLVRYVIAYPTGVGFVGGWVLIPTVGAAVVLLILVLRRCLRERWSYPVVLTLAIAFAPFALSVALGTGLDNRAMQALPLVASSVWLLVAFVLPARRLALAALVTAAVLFAVWDAGINTRLFLTEQMTYETDRTIAAQIVDRLARAGWDGRPVPIVTVGTRSQGKVESIAKDEVFGGSFFNWDGGLRASTFMSAMGYPMLFPTIDERADALGTASSMPAWPVDGSVVLENGLAIVKFGEP